ncbi:MAG: transposase [Deltaproteobacteria bacterium]|nr:transposase [Deltaproteobacteria bacterium]
MITSPSATSNTRVVRTFVRMVFSWQRRQAKAMGLSDVHVGSVTFAQRFGSLLQLTPHAHTWIPDGVFLLARA